MKIFFLANSFPNNDNQRTGVYNVRIVKQLSENGNDIFVGFFRAWKPGRPLIVHYNFEGIDVYQLSLPYIPFNKSFFFRFNIWICKYVGWALLKNKLKEINIIHSVDLVTNGIIAGYYAKNLRVPHVAQGIGSDINYGLNRIKRGRGFVKEMMYVNGIITNSLALENRLEGVINGSIPIKTIYRGVNISNSVENVHKNGEEGGTIFLFLGGFAGGDDLDTPKDTKGAGTLTKAWEMSEERLRELNAFLYFGGPGTNRGGLTRWRDRLKCPELVNILGELSHKEAMEAIRKADVVVIPSMNEGLPNVLLESYASSKLVIGSNAGGIPEVILNGITGYIFERGNIDQLSELLIGCSRDKDLNNFMGSKGYIRVKEHFNARDYYRQIINFYETVLLNFDKSQIN